MLRRIVKNKPLAVAVLILVSLPLIFHDYFIPPRERIVEHIPAWAIEYAEVEFAREDLGLLLGQVAWLVKALQRKAVMEEGIGQELEWLADAREAVEDGRSLLKTRLEKQEDILKDRKLAK
ncbi:MAG: hypothetical protein JRJ29_16860, partial [Deltaproteobacteria bacterium]|nr:hypothetical protein [Deltaproteobacteria bacterium]